jgi:hypothetical protein
MQFVPGLLAMRSQLKRPKRRIRVGGYGTGKWHGVEVANDH